MELSLTNEQSKVYDEILNSDDRVIVLLGRAGTGKTHLISYLINNYEGSVIVTATTNKAKKILARKTGRVARTIHSYLGFAMTAFDRTQILSKVVDNDYSCDLLIVDEVSMLNKQVFDELLKSKSSKILLVGDLLQLPTIGKKIDLSSYKTLYLLTNMRQENPQVAEFMDKLRDSVSTKKALDFKKSDLPNNIKLYESHKEFCKAYLDCDSEKRILAYSNRVVDSYNTNINGGVKFKLGDLLVLEKPLGSAKNGDIVEVLDIDEKEDSYKLAVSYENETHTIVVFKTNSAEDLFFNQIKDNRTYWYCKDKTFKPKHLYASTIHKAQGDTIDEVFVDLTDIYSQLFRRASRYNNFTQPISVDEYLKLVYVAISRMKSKAHIFFGEKRDYKYLKGDK